MGVPRGILKFGFITSPIMSFLILITHNLDKEEAF